MDYQYINTIKGETYLDLDLNSNPRYSTVKAFPAQVVGDIKKYGSLDYFLRTDINEVLTYFKVSYPGNPPIEVLAKVTRKKNSVSVGRFTQCFGWQWIIQQSQNADVKSDNKKDDEVKDKLERFETIISTPFYAESEVDALAEGAEIPEQATSAIPQIDVNIKPEALRAVFYGAMLCWLRGDPAVQIAVPSVVDYTAYVVAAVRKIYSYFPIGLRTEAGFCSYLPREKARDLPAIFLGFIPESMADANTVFLDGSSAPAINALNKGTGLTNLNLFIDYTCRLKDDKLTHFICNVYADSEESGAAIASNNITPIKYSYLGDAIRLLTQQGDIQKWKQFYSAFDKYPHSMREDIDKAIRGELTADMLKASIMSDGEDVTTAEGIAAVMKGYNALCGKDKGWSDAAWEAMCKLLRTRTHIDTNGLLSFAKTYRSDLNNIISRDREALIYIDLLRKTYDEISSRELTKSKQVEPALADAKKLYDAAEEVYKSYESEEAKEFTTEAQGLVQRLENLLLEFSKDNAELKERLENSGEYFAALKIYKENFKLIAAMEKEKKDELWTTLQSLRPKSFTEYINALKLYCGIGEQNITLADISHLSEKEKIIVINDLISFAELPLELTNKNKARDISNQIYFMEEFAKRLSPKYSLRVKYDGNPVDAKLLRNLADCKLTPKDVKDAEDVKRLLYALIFNGAYRVRDIPAICAMTEACELNAYKFIFQKLIAGKFGKADEKDYYAAFDCLCRYVVPKQDETPTGCLEMWSQKVDDVSEEAEDAFESYLKAYRRAMKPKTEGVSPALAIALGALALLLLAMSVILFVKYRKNTVQISTAENQIDLLEQQLDDSYAVSLFGKEFDEYAERFEKVCNKGENADTVKAYYDKHNIEEVAYTYGDQQVKWGEYVFWAFVLASDDEGNITQEAINAAQLKINSAVALMHPTTVPEATPNMPDLNDGTNASETENADNTSEDGNVDENGVYNESVAGDAEPQGNQQGEEATAAETPAQTDPAAQTDQATQNDGSQELDPEQTDAEQADDEDNDEQPEETPEPTPDPESAQESSNPDEEIIEMVRALFDTAKAALGRTVN
jgi:hypothetical protein